jgi:hypothetical protein
LSKPVGVPFDRLRAHLLRFRLHDHDVARVRRDPLPLGRRPALSAHH